MAYAWVGGGKELGETKEVQGSQIPATYADHVGRRCGVYEFIPTKANPLPVLLDGVQEPVHNPYGNPMPYDGGVPVRSKKCTVVGPPLEDTCLSRMYTGTSEWSQDLFINTVPDTTLMARPVYWPQDPAPDIVSRERDVTVLNRRV